MASMATQKRSSSSASSFTPKWNYDVFVSFRGEDAAKTFTDHLCTSLNQKGLVTFRGHGKLPSGEETSTQVLEAIEESRLSIIVLSENYASSTWCLDELVKVLECKEAKGQMVVPIFYDVGPSEVRKQTASFAQAFAKHEEDFKEKIERVQRWRMGMTEVANLSGWDLRNVADGHEAKFIQKIVQDILFVLNRNHAFLYVAEDQVGIHSRVEIVNFLLGVGGSDVRVIGICGIGGIGKTTIAKTVYNRIHEQFEGSCFLSDVRNVSRGHGGLVHLQRKLLSEILKEANLKISNDDRGVFMIRERLRHRRVLVILDDVDQLDQLEKLAGKPDWFGLGSRIIITTRDEHLLTAHEVNEIYMVEKLNYDEALQLFSLNAFKEDCPASDFLELSNRVVGYASGLPVALKVLGAFLFDKRSLDEWKSALDKLQKIPSKDIHEILKVSFDGLDDKEKKIFLYVACFFNGENKDLVTKVLEGFGLDPDITLRVLAQRSLITISHNKLWMHDLVQEMGRNIVLQESQKEFGKNSRLWLMEDVYQILSKNTGMEAKSMPPNFHPMNLFEHLMCCSRIERPWKTKILENLKSLNLSHSQCLAKTSDFSGIPMIRQLKSLETPTLFGCSELDKLPEDFGNMQNLGTSFTQKQSSVVLSRHLRLLSIHKWKSRLSPRLITTKNPCSSSLLLPVPPNLSSSRSLDLTDSNPSEGPIVSDIVSLSSTNVNFVEGVQPRTEESVGFMHLREIIPIKKCGTLQSLSEVMMHNKNDSLGSEINRCSSTANSPKRQSLTTLRQLKITNCPSLESKKVLLDQKYMSLEYLEIDGILDVYFPTAELPARLKQLKIVNCPNLELLLEGILDNTSLESLQIHGCCSLISFPIGDSSLPNYTSRSSTPTSNPRLRELEIWDCMKLKFLPEGLHNFTCLDKLSISNCPSLVSFPEGGLPTTNMKLLMISECENLKSLPYQIHKVTSLHNLSVCSCPSLMSFPEGGLPTNLESLSIIDCENLRPLFEWELHKLVYLRNYSIIGGCPYFGLQ